mgnify:CR=1 FL=1
MGSQLQFNIVAAESLKTQENPVKYENIPVRAAGFLQMFKLVDEVLHRSI